MFLCSQKHVLTKTQFNYQRLDDVLRLFCSCPGGYIADRHLFNEPIEDWVSAISLLTEEGYLKQLDNGHQITNRGKMLIEHGGFSGQHRRELITHWCCIVAAISGVIAAVVSVLSLLTQ